MIAALLREASLLRGEDGSERDKKMLKQCIEVIQQWSTQ